MIFKKNLAKAVKSSIPIAKIIASEGHPNASHKTGKLVEVVCVNKFSYL